MDRRQLCAHAEAAPVSESRVGELVHGLLRRTRSDGNALASGFLLLLSWSELAGRLVTPQHDQMLRYRRLASGPHWNELHAWLRDLVSGTPCTRTRRNMRFEYHHRLMNSQRLLLLPQAGLSLFVGVNLLNGHRLGAKSRDLQSGVPHSVNSTQLQPGHLRKLVQRPRSCACPTDS